MATDDVHPRLGRIGSRTGRKNQKYLTRIVRDMNRSAQPGSRNRRSSFSGARSGRGYAAAASFYGGGFKPGRRRVVVKARITKFKGGRIDAARAHLRYLQRDGVTQEGKRGELYSELSDSVDGKAFLEEAKGDRHQFRFIVAPEEASQISDLKPFIRDLFSQAERDLGTKLDWVAVDHFNTVHPHSHVVVRGRDDLGADLVIARDYMAHGFRERARDLVTLELGPEAQAELDLKLQAELPAERLTRIDRSLLRDAEQGIVHINETSASNSSWASLKIGRLQKLQSMGLAEELKPGDWRIAERARTVLIDLGQRNDIIKTMHRVLKEVGQERGVHEFGVFRADDPTAKVVGKIVGIGTADEMSDRRFVLVDGIDGRLHYAEIGNISESDPPGRGVLVTLRGCRQDQSVGKQGRQANMFVESHVPFDQLASANGATWLDRQLVSNRPEKLAGKGFGVEAEKLMLRRQQWLVAKGLMVEKGDVLVARRRMLAELTRRDVEKAGAALASKLGIKRVRLEEMAGSGEFNIQSIRLTSGKFAMLRQGREFAIVPWQHAMRIRKTLSIGGDLIRGMSR